MVRDRLRVAVSRVTDSSMATNTGETLPASPHPLQQVLSRDTNRGTNLHRKVISKGTSRVISSKGHHSLYQTKECSPVPDRSSSTTIYRSKRALWHQRSE
jgi:hypothetical protein